MGERRGDEPPTRATPEVEPAAQVRYSVLSPTAILIAAGLIVLVGVGVAVWLLLAYGEGSNQARNQMEAIKMAGTIAVGTGGAAALLLAPRGSNAAPRSPSSRRTRDQADVARAHALQERIAAKTRAHQEQVAADTSALRRPRSGWPDRGVCVGAAGPGHPHPAADHRQPAVRLPAHAL